MVWMAQNLQFVVFTLPKPNLPDAFSVWLPVVGNPPLNYTRSLPNGNEGSMASGGVDGHEIDLNISVQAGRLDLFVNPKEGVRPGASSAPPLLTDVDGALEIGMDLASKLIEQDDLPLRVAVVLNLVEMMDDLETVSARFQAATRTTVPDNAVELNFQFNTRRQLGSAGWEMNRLCRWSTGQFQLFHVQIGSAMPAPSMVSQGHFFGLMIDVNSVPRNIPLGVAQAKSAMSELAQEARAIMSDGYERILVR